MISITHTIDIKNTKVAVEKLRLAPRDSTYYWVSDNIENYGKNIRKIHYTNKKTMPWNNKDIPKNYERKRYVYYDCDGYTLTNLNLWVMKIGDTFVIKVIENVEDDGTLKFIEFHTFNEQTLINLINTLLARYDSSHQIEKFSDLRNEISMDVESMIFEDYSFRRSISYSPEQQPIVYYYFTRDMANNQALDHKNQTAVGCSKIIYHLYKTIGIDQIQKHIKPMPKTIDFEKIESRQLLLQNNFELLLMKHFAEERSETTPLIGQVTDEDVEKMIGLYKELCNELYDSTDC